MYRIIFLPVSFLDRTGNSEHIAFLKEQLESDISVPNALEHLAALDRFVKDQRRLAENHRDIKVLTRAFRHLPNLHVVHVGQCTMNVVGIKGKQGKGPFDGEIPSINQNTTLFTLLGALEQARIGLTAFRIGEHTTDRDIKLSEPAIPSSDNPFRSVRVLEFVGITGEDVSGYGFKSKRMIDVLRRNPRARLTKFRGPED